MVPAPAPTPHTFTFAQRIEQVDSSPAGQERLAGLMNEAIDGGDLEQIALALRTLGLRLGVFRGANTTPELAMAAQRMASTDNPQLAAMQPRYTVPLAELLLDIGDRAALDRLAEHAGASAGAQHVHRAAAAGRAGREAMVTVALPSGELPCALTVDGQPVDAAAPLSLTMGSHAFACGDERQLVTLQAQPYAVEFRNGAMTVAAAPL